MPAEKTKLIEEVAVCVVEKPPPAKKDEESDPIDEQKTPDKVQ